MIVIGIIVFCIILDLAVFISDKYLLSALLLAVECALAYYFLPGVSEYIQTTGWSSIFTTLIPMYIGIGVAVAFLKWVHVNIKHARELRRLVGTFNYKPGESLNQYEQFIRHLRDDMEFTFLQQVDDFSWSNIFGASTTLAEMNKQLTLKAGNYIDRISSWIIQWPLVVIAMIIEDFLVEFAKMVSNLFSTLSERIFGRMVSDATSSIGRV